ncbi:MAG: phenylalanine--tRNA ligase beta subunit-related protein [Candidatus Aminicenantes bacterium]|nr:phenylalanine--tRNA ligase beta subunit-related protein [Candidatus Aminicenantes bacterium]
MIQPRVKNLVSDRLSVGINIFFDISVKNRAGLSAYIQKETSAILERHTKQLPPGFSFSRKLYQAFSVDPTKNRPSSEALLRRIKKGLEFPLVNPFVDLTNFLSLKYQASYGLYDLDKVEGDIEITQGSVGESYQGIRKDIINLEGKILLRDSRGPFGNPSSDSLRASTTDETVNLVQVIFFHKEDPLKEKILSETCQRFFEFFKVTDSKTYLL